MSNRVIVVARRNNQPFPGVVPLVILLLAVVAGAKASPPVSPPQWDGSIGVKKSIEFFATDVAVAPSGEIYFTDAHQSSVFRYRPDGTEDLQIRGMPSFVRGINVGSDGKVYVGANTSRDIRVYDETGSLIDTWKNVGNVNGEGCFSASEGLLYLADGNQVIALDEGGAVVRRFSGSGTGLGQHTSLRDIAVDPAGDIWTVNESNPPRVQKFSPNGEVKLAFGSMGSGPGQFRTLVSIGIDSHNNVYVSDRRNYRVQKFDSEGKFLTAWGSKGNGPGQFLESHGLTVAPDDTVWVAGFHAHSIQQFNSNGDLLTFWQGSSPGPGEFTEVRGLAVVEDVVRDGVRYDKVLYASDFWMNRIQALDPDSGEPLFEFGERGQGLSTVFNFPVAIGVGPDRSLYISDDGATRRIAPDGTFIDYFMFREETGGQIVKARGIAINEEGILSQVNGGRNTVFTIDTSIPRGDLISEWGGTGDGPGLFNNIRGIGLFENELYISDQKDRSMEIYSLDGRFLRAWPLPISAAFGVAINERAEVGYVGSWGRVGAFDLLGNPLFTFGTTGDGPGQFGGEIHAIAVDSEGTVFAADTMNGRIHRFRYPASVEHPPLFVTGRLARLEADQWQTVKLPHSYVNPIIIATVQRPGGKVIPAVARVRNRSERQFELQIQQAVPPTHEGQNDVYDVEYLVVEAGVYTAREHGVTMEAGTFNSRQTDSSSSWVGEGASYQNSYSSPVVFGQVMTANDENWSVFWALGSWRGDVPNAKNLRLGKHVGEDPDTGRVEELVGYLVIEAGQGVADGSVYQAGISDAVVQGTGNAPPYVIPIGVSAAGAGAILSAAGMKGGDGGWPVFYGSDALGSSGLRVAFEEDLMSDAETWHLNERVAYLVVRAQ